MRQAKYLKNVIPNRQDESPCLPNSNYALIFYAFNGFDKGDLFQPTDFNRAMKRRTATTPAAK
jgi:hypothetical protein